MSEEKDGAPAFPTGNISGILHDAGLSKREYYAAHAPITIKDAVNYVNEEEKVTYEKLFRILSRMRFSYADAMIAASAEEGKKP